MGHSRRRAEAEELESLPTRLKLTIASPSSLALLARALFDRAIRSMQLVESAMAVRPTEECSLGRAPELGPEPFPGERCECRLFRWNQRAEVRAVVHGGRFRDTQL